MNGLGNKIRILRYRKGWSQEMLAQKLGISIFVLSQIESDDIDLYYLTIVKLSELLNAPISVLLATGKSVKIELTEKERIEKQILEYHDYLHELKEKYNLLKERFKN